VALAGVRHDVRYSVRHEGGRGIGLMQFHRRSVPHSGSSCSITSPPTRS
jgi:hypothetical protein